MLLKALNDQGKMKGLVNLINTTKAGITDFFRHAGLYNITIPRKYGKDMRYSNMTIFLIILLLMIVAESTITTNLTL